MNFVRIYCGSLRKQAWGTKVQNLQFMCREKYCTVCPNELTNYLFDFLNTVFFVKCEGERKGILRLLRYHENECPLKYPCNNTSFNCSAFQRLNMHLYTEKLRTLILYHFCPSVHANHFLLLLLHFLPSKMLNGRLFCSFYFPSICKSRHILI